MNRFTQKVKELISNNVILFILPVLVIIFVFRESLLGQMFNNGDVVYNLLNYSLYYFRGGYLITQNILSGFPVLSSVAAIWFYPINDVASYFLGPFHAYSVLNVFNLILTYVFCFLFSRRLKLSYFSAIFTASVFTFSGQLMLWVGLLTNTNYYFLLPLSLLLVDIAASMVGWKRVVFMVGVGISCGVSWLSSHVQYVFYIHAFVAIYWLYISSDFSSVKNLYKKSLEILFAYIVSFFVGYPQIFAILDIRSVSARETGVKLSDFWAGSFLPQDFIHYFLPFFKIPFIPFSNPNLYIGILSLSIVFIGFIFWREIEDKKFRLFFWTFIFCLIASIKYSPVGVFLHLLPFFDSFREAPRIMFIGNFAIAIVAGFSLDFIVNNKSRISDSISRVLYFARKFTLYILIPITVFITILELCLSKFIVKLLTDYFIKYKYAGTSGLPVEHYTSLISQSLYDVFLQTSLVHSTVPIFLFFSVSSYLLMKNINILSSKMFYILCIFLTLLNFAVIYEGHYLYVSKQEYNKPPSVLDYLKPQTNKMFGEHYRLYSIFPGQTRFREIDIRCGNKDPKESFLLNKEMLLPDINMDFNVDVLAGYDNFMPKRISELLDLVGSEQSVTNMSLAEKNITTEEKINILVSRKNLLRMMNVRYIISRYDILDKDFSKIHDWKVGDCQTPLNLYELSNYWPRYFLTDNFHTFQSTTSKSILDIFNEKIVSSQDPYPYVYLDDINSDYLELKKIKKTPNLYKAVTPIYNYDSMEFSISTDKDTLLYVGNAYLPKWSATIDGVDTKVYIANYAYMAVFVPKGAHKVLFKYIIPNRLPFIK